MTHQVFIDGREGTTGLRIYDRLSARDDISLVVLPEQDRKDLAKRKEALNNCDIAFLCLPDAAAREAVSMVENPNVKLIDASTAHRTEPGWAYGFPELSPEHFEAVRNSKRVAVPGCHAGGFVALVYPLLKAGILPADIDIACHSITGYSGGGKKMIAQYENANRDPLLDAPRQYGLTQQHKHLKEMQYIPGLAQPPIFCPIVSDFYSGMVVTVPVFTKNLLHGAGIEEIKAVYRNLYRGPVVSFCEEIGENGFISGCGALKRDSMKIFVEGNEDRVLLLARFDNLGKGASGAAMECMDIMIGNTPDYGLVL
ncbi:MAG: N-acetyl-gamma-glutamyl-phosphate reductase [Oscillospiraceae bacterium]|jgi:N-acetyl-gamma-glutamyl-phosphate reductase